MNKKIIAIYASLIFILLFLISNYIVLKSTNRSLLDVMVKYQQSEPYYIIVDLDDYTLNVYKDYQLYETFPCAGGKRSTPSPLGTWKIISKDNWGEGFGGSWLGFNVPWGKYGIHGTNEAWSIGSPASEGCIRMNNKDVKKLKNYIPHGTKVTIIKGPFGPFGDEYRRLRPGHIGSDVYAVQTRLKELGYYLGWIDGKYGTALQRAVNKYQKEHKLPESKYITMPMYKSLNLAPFE